MYPMDLATIMMSSSRVNVFQSSALLALAVMVVSVIIWVSSMPSKLLLASEVNYCPGRLQGSFWSAFRSAGAMAYQVNQRCDEVQDLDRATHLLCA